MKRSEINCIIEESKDFFARKGFRLLPVAFWSPQQWVRRGPEIREIIDVGIGWDVTALGSGDPRYPKPCAEKIIIVGDGQLVLTHYHVRKTEDIINRGGGVLAITLHNAAPDDRLADTPVTVSTDGRQLTVHPGSEVTLWPGESITLPPRLYHSFRGLPGRGPVLVGDYGTRRPG